MVNEVNGERGEFDEYDVCSEWQKGQKVGCPVCRTKNALD